MQNGFHVDILQALYDSEINCALRWLWDGGIDWKLFLPNDKAIEGNAPTVKDAIRALRQAALTHFPDSEFAKKHKP